MFKMQIKTENDFEFIKSTLEKEYTDCKFYLGKGRMDPDDDYVVWFVKARYEYNPDIHTKELAHFNTLVSPENFEKNQPDLGLILGNTARDIQIFKKLCALWNSSFNYDFQLDVIENGQYAGHVVVNSFKST